MKVERKFKQVFFLNSLKPFIILELYLKLSEHSLVHLNSLCDKNNK